MAFGGAILTIEKKSEHQGFLIEMQLTSLLFF
jgi:hypothetical protein